MEPVAGRASDVAALLAAYDEQMRPAEVANLPAGVHAERDGPIFRVVGQYRGFIASPVDLTLDGDGLDVLIARQRGFFAARGEAVEWKSRALVARRADLAAARGVRHLQVDASDDSRPILQRLGFVAVTTTTPYVWTPPAPAGAE